MLIRPASNTHWGLFHCCTVEYHFSIIVLHEAAMLTGNRPPGNGSDIFICTVYIIQGNKMKKIDIEIIR
jgi:hypothetical protein